MNDEIKSFIDSYRESLDQQRDLGMQNLENNRRNQFQSIMAGANRAGMLYSNFPERARIQYDTGTYLPSVAKLQTTYQTGLDKLRSNSVNLVNQLANINDAIKDLNDSNKSSTTGVPGYGTKLNDANDYFYRLPGGGTQFRDANRKNIRFGTAAKRAGMTTPDQILAMAQQTLAENEYNRLKNIYNTYKTNYPNFVFNVGSSFKPNTADYLSDSDRGFLDSLGLAFGS